MKSSANPTKYMLDQLRQARVDRQRGDVSPVFSTSNDAIAWLKGRGTIENRKPADFIPLDSYEAGLMKAIENDEFVEVENQEVEVRKMESYVRDSRPIKS